MKAIAYIHTAVSALLTVTAMIAVVIGYTHQLGMMIIGLFLTLAGMKSIEEENEKEVHDGR